MNKMTKYICSLSVLLFCGIANAANVSLAVDAKSNCLDLRKLSMSKAASAHIDNGKYQVRLTNNTARYHQKKLPVNKVSFYITTDDNPNGWFYTINDKNPIMIVVSGKGAEANRVFGYYTDIICGDNTGGSVLTFDKKK